ncbi:SPOR domain-containing protein [Thiomicrorhabdus sp.]|uniref:SPOR domain-containing protein n=1 Tax=Thiomicrorhabdus sp. TaxID=2039724 RepID=UPI0029C8DC51|nr:SPOR domain-containing protein [Thiomicrorhabdus sp.]
MDPISKHRLTGAAIWLILLIWIVPDWYSHPVNFHPKGVPLEENQATRPLVEHPFLLSGEIAQPGDPHTVTPQKPVATDQELYPVMTEEEELAQKGNDRSQLALPPLKKIETASKGAISPRKAVSAKPEVKAAEGDWLLLLASYKEKKNAQSALERLQKQGHSASIKFFQKSKVYSLRSGPYSSKLKAEQDKRKLDKMLHIKSVVVQRK